MSLFGSTTAASGGSASGGGGGGLFGGLNLNTGGNPPPEKRKSIFEPPATQSSSGSPFSFPAASTASAAPSGGLFGPSTTTTAAAPSGGLFGSATTTNAAAPAASGGLFGAASKPAAAPSGSLFGATTTSMAAPAAASTQPATSSFFGAPATQQQPGGASAFGVTTGAGQQPPAQPPTASAQPRDAPYFNSLLERQKKKQKLQNEANGRLSGLNMDLGDLARRAQEIRNKGKSAPDSGADGRAHYVLAASGVAPGQAYREFQAVGTEDAPAASRMNDPALLDESTNYLRDLRSKSRETMMRESMARVYREVDSFIEESLGIDFEEQKARIMEHFGLAPKDDGGLSHEPGASTGGAFGRSRHGKESTGNSIRGTRSVFGKSAIDKSLIGAPGSVAGTRSFFKSDGGASSTPGSLSRGQTMRDLRDKEREFVAKVTEMNEARVHDNPVKVMELFCQAEKAAQGDSPRHLVDAYDALREITRESSTTVRERQYAQAYLDDSPSAVKNMALKKQILEGSRTYLEKAFYHNLESLISKNAREAQLGGVPTVINKVRAYIKLRALRRDLAPDGAELQQIGGEKGDYCWVLIFYLLRCGFVREAAEYVNNDAAFQSTDRRFVGYMTRYADSPDRRLSRKYQEMIDGEYQQRAKIAQKGSVDPYRMACYKVLGRCDLSSRNLEGIGQGVEDWLWLQFVLARETDRQEELAGDIFGLEQIGETVAEIGQKHFQKSQIEGSAYGTYFFMQILSGMFEQAVDYLHSFSPVSAVHFAIALAYYGLLRVSDYSVAGNELLTYSTTQQPLINFVPLVAYYTATFRTALPVAAVDYLSMICLNSDLQPVSLGTVQTNACYECLRELCLETREFAKLLGDIQSDGSRILGAIDMKASLIRLGSRGEFVKNITSQSAATADQRGQVADAVLLYHLCEDYDSVVNVLIRSLADAVSLDLGETPMQLQPLKPRRQNGGDSSSGTAQGSPKSSLSLTQSTSSPAELARNMIALYNSNAMYYDRISSQNRDTCGALIRLLGIRSKLEMNPPQFMSALEELNQLGILPLSANGNIPEIRAAATAFGAMNQIMVRCAGISVVWAVRALGGERDRILQHGVWDTGYGGSTDATKEHLNSMAKDLMVFAGLVKYKLPSRVYDMLTRAGGDVGSY